MFKVLQRASLILLSAAMIMVYCSIANAYVYFITDFGDLDSSFMKSRPCVQDGYTLVSCSDNRVPKSFCPQNGIYFKECICSPNKYKFDQYNCSYPKVLNGNNCGSDYEECTCDAAKFKYDSANCFGPKVVSGLNCNQKYETCSCPAEYYLSCGGNMVGDGNSCDGKYNSCKCSSLFKSCSKGPEIGAVSCLESNGAIKYSQCKGNSCENGGYLPYIPTNNACDVVDYEGMTCYKNCRELTCADGGYYEKNPSETITCPSVDFAGKTCYDCDSLCGYCNKYYGSCKQKCTNDCKSNIWFENKINGAFECEQ